MEIRRVGRPEALPTAVRNEIERLIADAGLQPGSKLPSEKELAEQLGTGRSSVREALRAMQEIGMIEVMHGKGAFVQNQSHKAIEAHLHFLMNFEAQAREDLTELRQVLEAGLVQLAARRATDEDIAAIGTCLEEMTRAETTEQQVEAGARFHLAVARAAKNAFATSIYEAVTQVINQVYSAMERSQIQKQQSVDDHEEIYRAIANHDPETAMRKTREHLMNLDRSYGAQSGRT